MLSGSGPHLGRADVVTDGRMSQPKPPGIDDRQFARRPRHLYFAGPVKPSLERPRRAISMFPIANTVPTRSMPLVTWGLIAANGVVFIFEASLDPLNFEWFVWRFALVPARDFALLTGDAGGPAATDYLRFVTNTFLHGGWLHLTVTILTLRLFGPLLQHRPPPPPS